MELTDQTISTNKSSRAEMADKQSELKDESPVQHATDISSNDASSPINQQKPKIEDIDRTDLQIKVCENDESNKSETKVGESFQIRYVILSWILLFLLTGLTVYDRFALNLWSMGVDGDIPEGADWSVALFYIVAQISGRMMLVSSSYIMLTMNDVFWNWFYEHYLCNKSKWYFKWLKIENIKECNSHLHYYTGIFFIGIPVVLHCWTIIFAALFPINEITFLSSWKRADPNGQKIPFYENHMLNLGWNDTYRLITTSVCFFIIFPYSMIKILQQRNWSLAMYLHLIAGTIYQIDLIRIKSHPHTWVFNVPFIFWWICDRIYGIFYYRRCVANLIRKVPLGNDGYLILYLRVKDSIKELSKIGDQFYLNILDCGWDRAHPFTVFYNHNYVSSMTEQEHIDNEAHLSHKFSFQKRDRQSSEIYIQRKVTESYIEDNENDIIKESNDWNVGFIVKVHSNHNGKCLDVRNTWTSKISDIDSRFHAGFRCFGPYRSDYNLLHSIKFINKRPLILLSTGAGCGYMIDFYNYVIAENIKFKHKIEYYFSTESIPLFQWFTNITCSKPIQNFHCNVHTTVKNKKINYECKNDDSRELDRMGSRDAYIGRMEFDELLTKADKNAHVFYCGSPILQKKIKKLCKHLGLTYHADVSF